jgi:hypothetical protein
MNPVSTIFGGALLLLTASASSIGCSQGEGGALCGFEQAAESGGRAEARGSSVGPGEVGGPHVSGGDASSGAGCSSRFTRNPVLDALPDNTALDLGRYECRSRLPQIPDVCETITDFSRLIYDPYQHRGLMFGGGHSATGRTDVDVFSFDSLSWNSLYASMSCSEVAQGDIDPRGFHRKTGHPTARHTYDMMTVVDDGNCAGRLVLVAQRGTSAGVCHRYDNPIIANSFLPLTAEAKSWTHGAPMLPHPPWLVANAAEFDPSSGTIVIAGTGAPSGGLWVYDLQLEKVRAHIPSRDLEEIHSNLILDPVTGIMYFIRWAKPGKTTSVWKIELDRSDWKKTKITPVPPAGNLPPRGLKGFAYDSAHRVIGGAVTAGKFYVFDPITDTWSAEQMNVRSKDGATPGSMTALMLDYDPVNNVFLFIADGPKGRRTWAYRYRK